MSPIHDQEPWPTTQGIVPRFYAYCPCGVCGPLRTWRKDAQRDDETHRSVCSSGGAA